MNRFVVPSIRTYTQTHNDSTTYTHSRTRCSDSAPETTSGVDISTDTAAADSAAIAPSAITTTTSTPLLHFLKLTLPAPAAAVTQPAGGLPLLNPETKKKPDNLGRDYGDMCLAADGFAQVQCDIMQCDYNLMQLQLSISARQVA